MTHRSHDLLIENEKQHARYKDLVESNKRLLVSHSVFRTGYETQQDIINMYQKMYKLPVMI